MKKAPEIARAIDLLAGQHGEFRRCAFEFVQEAVLFTVSRLEERRHVKAFELLEGARDYARDQYGFLARAVLFDMGIFSAENFGNVVFLLIGAGVLSADRDDRQEDFIVQFDLAPIPLPLRPRRMPLREKIDA
ncbi:MAG: hypothetical protein PHS41_07910 [Victivallaceae bacterium]|nr:hypothetical protein [Victivallaceae bacterium]